MLKTLENVTRSQIKEMGTQEVTELMDRVMKEAQGEKCRAALLEILEKTEAQIVTPKVNN